MTVTDFIPFSGPWLYILIVIFALLLIQIFYYIFFFGKLNRYTKNITYQENSNLPPLSVIICAKNESKNLEKNLPLILNQKYPQDFQVIVVNDASEDDTDLILARFKQKYDNLYYTTIPYDKIFRHGKKLAITIGVKAAKYEHMVFTDADCIPANESWLKYMASGFSKDHEIVLGFGAYKKEKGLLNTWLRYDTFYIAITYLSFALRGVPYMGVGRNMAYTKSLFYKQQGFKSHQHIMSGDDDLFIRDAATSKNTNIVIIPESHTLSEPSKTFKEWKRQKTRHLTTSPFYKRKIKFLLGLETFSRQLFWGISLISIFFPTFALTVLLMIVIKVIVQLSILRITSKRLGQNKLYWCSILFDFILPVVTAMLFLGSKRKANKNKWT